MNEPMADVTKRRLDAETDAPNIPDRENQRLRRELDRERRERRQAETRYEQLLSTVNRLPVSVAVLDLNLNYVTATEAYRRHFPLPFDTLAGKHLFDVFPDLPPRWEEILQQLVAGKMNHWSEDQRVVRHGITSYVRQKFDLLADGHGRVKGLTHTLLPNNFGRYVESALAESERRIQRLYENAPVGLFRSSAKGKLLTVNPALARMFGYDSPESMIWDVNNSGTADSFYVRPEQRNEISAQIREQRDWIRHEIQYYRKDRNILSAFLLLHTERDKQGNPVFIEGMVKDISRRKAAEAALHRSEEHFRAMIETTSDWIWEVDMDGRYTYSSPMVRDLLGYGPEEVLGKCPLDFMPAEEAERMRSAFSSFLKDPAPFHRLEKVNRHKDGRRLVLETSGVPIRDDSGRFVGFRGIDRNVTERRQAERTLQSERDRAQRFFDLAGVVFLVIGPDGRIQTVNRKGCTVLGHAEEEIVGQDWFSTFLPERLRQDVRGIFDRLMAGEIEPVEYVESPVLTAGGMERTIAWHNTVIRDEKGRITATLSSGEDITDRKSAEQALERERHRLFSVLESLPAAVLLINRAAEINFSNRTFKERFGKDFHALCHQDTACPPHPPCPTCPVMAVLATGRPQKWEKETPDGEFFQMYAYPFVDSDGADLVLEVGLDVTEQKLLEREAVQAGRLASIGELAAGVAHEINNPINGVINYAQLLADQAAEDDRSAELPRRILREGERVASIVKNLLAYSRQGGEVMEPVDLAEVVADALELMQKQIRQDGIRLSVDLPETLPLVQGNPQKLQQVVMNLVSNARYALNRKFPGPDAEKRLTLRADEHLRDGNVRLAVHDTGCGISAEDGARIFDPFFTTKPVGEGTGLGLSISYGIVREHGGTLTYDSRKGAYTEIRIDLPAAIPSASAL